MSSGTGSLRLFLLAIHCWKLFSARAVVLAVLAGVIPLESSSSLAKAKRLEDVDGCGSLEQEGGRSDRSCSGSGHGVDSVATSAFPGQPVQEHMPRQKRIKWTNKRLSCEVDASHGDSLSVRNGCCYGAKEARALRQLDFQPIRGDI